MRISLFVVIMASIALLSGCVQPEKIYLDEQVSPQCTPDAVHAFFEDKY